MVSLEPVVVISADDGHEIHLESQSGSRFWGEDTYGVFYDSVSRTFTAYR